MLSTRILYTFPVRVCRMAPGEWTTYMALFLISGYSLAWCDRYSRTHYREVQANLVKKTRKENYYEEALRDSAFEWFWTKTFGIQNVPEPKPSL